MKKIIACFLLFVGTFCFSQDQQLFYFPVRQDTVRLQNLIKVGASLIDNIYVGSELYIFKDFSVNLEYGIGFSGHSVRKDNENSNNLRIHYLVDRQFAKVEFKWNYNFHKRHKQWKETAGNSSDYLALQFKYFEGKADTEPVNLFPILFYSNDGRRPDNILLTDVHWGMQRKMGDIFTLNFFIGLGFIYDFETHLGVATPTIGVKVNCNLIKF